MSDQSISVVFEPAPRIRKRLLGLRRKDVLRELEERDAAIETARKRAQAATLDAERLRKEMADLQAEAEELRGSSPAVGAAGGPHGSKFCDCPPTESLLEEMTRVVSVTEESTRKILEHARTTLMREIDAAEALRDQARSEIAQAAAWRQHWGPIIKAFQDTIHETQGAIDDIPERIRQALAPLTAAAAALDHDLLQFAALDGSIQGSPAQAEGDQPPAAGSPDAEAVPDEAGHQDDAIVVGEAEDESAGSADAADEATMPVS